MYTYAFWTIVVIVAGTGALYFALYGIMLLLRKIPLVDRWYSGLRKPRPLVQNILKIAFIILVMLLIHLLNS